MAKYLENGNVDLFPDLEDDLAEDKEWVESLFHFWDDWAREKAEKHPNGRWYEAYLCKGPYWDVWDDPRFADIFDDDDSAYRWFRELIKTHPEANYCYLKIDEPLTYDSHCHDVCDYFREDNRTLFHYHD